MSDARSSRTEKTKQRLLAAAFALFSLKGYEATTTREIAAQAGVSEVTLFRHFGTKENLFHTLIVERSPAKVIELGPPGRSTGGRCEEELARIGEALLANLRDNAALLRVVLAEAARNPRALEAWCGATGSLRDALVSYLGGALRPVRGVSLALAAQAFLGMFLGWAIEREMLRSPTLPPYDPAQVVGVFVKIFLDGVRPPGREADGGSR